MLTAKDNSKIGKFSNKFAVSLMKQGDIYNAESINRRFPFHTSICVFMCYSLTGKRPTQNPVSKVLTPTTLMPAEMLFLILSSFILGETVTKVAKKNILLK
jgi:hypothetical protein